MQDFIKNEFSIISNNFIKLMSLSFQIEQVTNLCIDSIMKGNKIMFCGNGGSASQAQHLAAELVGRYKLNRPAMNAMSLTVDTSIITAVGNDYGFDTIFERQVEGVAKSGDVLIGLSTSGNSQNIVLAFKKAKSMGVKNVAFTGEKDSKMKDLADITINVPSSITNNIQEMHLAVGHLICGIIEKRLAR